MSMRYTRRSGDVEYRRVPLTKTDVPEYIKFNMDGQSVDYSEDVVLEVRTQDGTEHLVYDTKGTKMAVTICKKEGNKYLVTVPATHAARLYIRDEKGMEYKIPGGLPPYKGSTGPLPNTCCFLIPKQTGGLQVMGDKYFNKVYNVNLD